MSDSKNDVQTPDTPPAKKKARWLDWVLIVFGLGCVGLFVLKMVGSRQAESTANRAVMTGLDEADRIPAAHGAARDFNVVVISMDTTRADRLACYGNRAVKTPVIDELARRGVLFENAFSPAPSTLPGHSTIFTGLYPYNHGARANGTFTLGSDQTTLAETMKAAGYATGGVISAYVLDSRFGLQQGFDTFHDDLTKGIRHGAHMFRERPAEFTNEIALSWIEEQVSAKFFLWIHYFDVHAPYLPPEPFRSEYARNLYDGEIAYVDKAIGNVVAKLEELGIRDKTLIVLAGDHGESLGEHGEKTHAMLIYDATMRTPLIFNAPGLFSEGHVVRPVVSNASIVPTVLDLVGIESAGAYDGVSLLQESAAWPAAVYGESISTLVLHGWAPLFSMRQHDYKYIHAPTPELYDLRSDPRELKNVFDDPEYADQVIALSHELDSLIGADRFGGSALAQAVAMDEETARNLSALGYVASVSSDDVDVEAASQLDPKEMVYAWEREQDAMNMAAEGRDAEAIEIFEDVIVEAPRNVFALRNLASSYIAVNRLVDAETMIRRAMEIEKQEPGLHTVLSTVMRRRGLFPEAEASVRQALELDPAFAPAHVEWGNLEANRGRWREAEKHFRTAIEMDPGSTGPSAYNQLGWMFARLLKAEEAQAAFEAALEIDATNGSAHAGLGSLLGAKGQYDEARQAFEAALKFYPYNADAWAALAGLYDKLGQYDEARQLAVKALELAETNVMAMNNLALIEKHLGKMDRAVELFNEALALQPDHLACRLNLAQCYYALGDEERAVDMLNQVLETNPRVPMALVNVGAFHESRGRHDEALEFFRRAVALDPNYAFGHAHLGAALLQRGELEAGLEHLRKSLELDPEQQGREELVYRIEEFERLIDEAVQGEPTKAVDSNGERP